MKLFVDTSVLLAGIIDFGAQSRASQSIFDAIAEGAIEAPSTAWHCCLETYSVATRLPEEFRLEPEEAVELIRHEILGRFEIETLPARRRTSFFDALAIDRIAGGRVYDAHLAEVARAAGADVVLTDNRRDFIGLLRHQIRVLTAAEFAREGL